jgi:hypothetical protein
MSVYYWLVNNGLWRDVVSWGVVVLLSAVVARSPWKRQKHIEDLLDTDKPGGLTEVVHALRSQQHQVSQQQSHTRSGGESSL